MVLFIHLVQSMENQTRERGMYYSTIAHQIPSFENQTSECGTQIAHLVPSLENQTGECGWYYSSIAHLIQTTDPRSNAFSDIPHAVEKKEELCSKHFPNISSKVSVKE